MCMENAAAGLKRLLEEAIGEQNILAGRVADMVCAWDEKLEPIKALMREYGIKFSNKAIQGETSKGIILGSSGECLYVLCGKLVKPVCKKTDEYEIEEKTCTVKEYVKRCDLETLKCGFEGVASVDSVPALEKNNELSDFLKRHKNHFLNK